LRYTIAAIVLIAAGLAAAVASAGHADDLGILMVAVLAVCFFAATPVVLGALSRRERTKRDVRVVRRDAPPEKGPPTSGPV
jgi:hypothetical protein